MRARFWWLQIAFAACWLNPFTIGPVMATPSWLMAFLLLGLFFACCTAGLNQLRLSWLICLTAVVCAGMGLLQFMHWADWAKPWISESPNGEVYANLRQRNQLASLLVMGMIALILLCSDKAGRHAKILYSLGIALLMCCLAATGSRTGGLELVGVVLGAYLMRTYLPSRALSRTIGAILIYVVCAVLLPSLSDWVGNSQSGLMGRLDEPNAFSRIALWSNVLELIAKQPWTGHGWRSLAYMHYSTEFSGERFMEMLDNAHNLPLHLAVELGVPVALLFCAAAGWLVWQGKPWAEKRPERLMAWGILLVIGIHSMVEYPLWYGPFFLTAMLCVMLLLQDWARDLILNWSPAGIKSARYAIQFIATALLAFTAFAAFDYHRVSQIYLQPPERSSWYADDALGAAQKSVLFQSHAKFAELVVTPLSRESAPRVLELSSELVHWSPEPRVIERLIESAVMMEMDDVAGFHLKRYRAAYPKAYEAWAQKAGTGRVEQITSGL